MRKNVLESRFWKGIVKPLLDACGTRCHYQRLEVSTSRGVPDLNLCLDNRETWIELKVKNKGQIEIRKEQHVWGTRRARSGGRVFVLVYDPNAKSKDKEVEIWQEPYRATYTKGRYCHPMGMPFWFGSIEQLKEKLTAEILVL